MTKKISLPTAGDVPGTTGATGTLAYRLQMQLNEKNERIKELTAENEQLRRDKAEWKEAQRECIDALGELEDRETELTAENERLREALRPFADVYNDIKANGLAGFTGLELGDLRRASNALATEQPQ